MAARKSLHVVPGPSGGWSLKHYGAVRAYRHFSDKTEAVTRGRELIRAHGGDFFIHRKDGSIQQKSRYGKDECPPRTADHLAVSG